MKALTKEIKLTIELMQGDIDDGAHGELQSHLYSLLEMKRELLGGHYPETRTINRFEVPAPETEVPVSSTDYYIATPTLTCLYSCETWNGNRVHRMWLERGLVFLNKEDAIAAAKSMLGMAQ